MNFFKTIAFIVCCGLSHCVSAMGSDALSLIGDIELMRMSYNDSTDILSKFDRVLHLPIQHKEGSTLCIAQRMSHIKPKHYALLEKKYKEKSRILIIRCCGPWQSCLVSYRNIF